MGMLTSDVKQHQMFIVFIYIGGAWKKAGVQNL